MALQQSNNSIPLRTIGERDIEKTSVERSAVRAILINPRNQNIALIYVAKGNYFKLPGGGVERGEDLAPALAREVLEETGCKVSVDAAECFAKSEEWRNDLYQLSFCYVAKVVEDTRVTELTELEVSEGLSCRWVSVDEAIELIRNAQPTSELGEFSSSRTEISSLSRSL